jgi:DNA-binding response OmpR family regulator
MKNILVVEDQASVVHLLKRYLEQSGYQVYVAYRGKEALEIIAQQHINLVLLDLMLPDTNGLWLCEELREQNPSLPIIIISAVDDTASKVQALHSCADDYIVKPFDMEEVLERINVQFRHAEHIRSGVEKQNFTAGPLSINFEQRRVIVNGQEVSLTYKEYELLRILVINSGKIVTYTFLRSQVWDDEYTSEYQSIHTYINRLRKKIEIPAQCRFLYNEPKVGYRFKVDEKAR